MPPTKKDPKPSAATTVSTNGQSEVLTLIETAAYLRLPEEDIVRLVRDQALPGRRSGTEWRFLKAAVQDWLRTGPAEPPTRPDFWATFAGAFENDPHLEEIVKEAYRKRGRPITEDE